MIFVGKKSANIIQKLLWIGGVCSLTLNSFSMVKAASYGPPEKPLHIAASYGRNDEVVALLAGGSDINEEDDGGTALHYAIWGRHWSWHDDDNHVYGPRGLNDVIATLLDNRPDINIRNHGDTPLNAAIRSSNTDVVRRLLDMGAVIEPDHVKDAIECASYNMEILDMLKIRSELPNSPEFQGKELIYASQYPEYNHRVSRLLDNGVDINYQYKGKTALSTAFSINNWEGFRMLLERGADPNIRDLRGNTLLHLSARAGRDHIVTLLLSKNANPHLENDDHQTALTYALEGNPYAYQDTVGILATAMGIPLPDAFIPVFADLIPAVVLAAAAVEVSESGSNAK